LLCTRKRHVSQSRTTDAFSVSRRLGVVFCCRILDPDPIRGPCLVKSGIGFGNRIGKRQQEIRIYFVRRETTNLKN
jgi:hypothetical protein